MITLKQFTGQSITPTDDATLYEFFSSGQNGLTEGCIVTHLGGNQLQISSGRGIICGRMFVIEEETVLADLSGGGEKKGRIYVRIDVDNTEKPIEIKTLANTILPEPVQEDINRDGSVYELPLAEYDVNETQVSNIKNVAIMLRSASSIWPFVKFGTYTGDGNTNRTFELNEQPKILFLWAEENSFNRYTNSREEVWAAFFSSEKPAPNYTPAMKGIYILDNGFMVQETPAGTPTPDNYVLRLNHKGVTYHYIYVI